MKLQVTLLLLCISLWATAQVTITAADVPGIGDNFAFAVDTLPNGIIPSAPGPEQLWDFSQLNEHFSYTEEIVDPASTPEGNRFPNATGAIISSQDAELYIYIQLTNDALLNIGVSGDLLDTGDPFTVPFNPPQKIFAVPSTYLTSYEDDYSLTTTIASPVPGADSIRIKAETHAVVTMDAYGTLVSPHGAYEVLRQKTEAETTTTISLLIFGFWVDQTPSTDVTVSYTFFNKEAKGRLLSFDVNDTGSAGSITYSTLPGSMTLPPVALFEISAQNNSTITFKDGSQANITSRVWDFGDGITLETDQTEVDHTYAASGDYTVCLIVENANGKDTLCKVASIITQMAPVAAFSFTGGIDGQFDFTDLSTNDPTSWLWNFGDGNTSTEQNPNHTFADTGSYNVCLAVTNSVGSDTYCQTVRPVFTPQAAFAFQYTNVLREVAFTDQSLNDPVSWSWDFGDGNGSTEQNPSHVYEEGMYNVCLTVANSAGTDEVCQTVNVIIGGTAGFNNSLDLKVFPNPSSDYLMVQLTEAPVKGTLLQIHNALGQQKWLNSLQQNQQIDLTSWAAGTYTWTILRRNGDLMARGSFVVLP